MNVQNSYFYVKIGLWILTTNFTKIVIIKLTGLKNSKYLDLYINYDILVYKE